MLKELKRKIIHLIGLLIPICYYFFRERDPIAIIILLSLTAIYFFLELLRLTNKRAQRYFLTHFSSLLRTHEKQKVTGTGYYLLSALLCVSFFKKELPSLIIYSFTTLWIKLSCFSILCLFNLLINFFHPSFVSSSLEVRAHKSF